MPAIPGSAQARRRASARTSGVPAVYTARSKTDGPYSGTKPRRTSSASPWWKSSTAKELAGAMTAIRAPGASARGFRGASDKCCHLVGYCLVLLATENGSKRCTAQGRLASAKETLLDTAVARQRILCPVQRDTAGLNRADHGLERLELRGLVGAAHQHGVAPSLDCHHGRLRDAVPGTDGLHLEVVRQHQTTVAELSLEQIVDDLGRERSGAFRIERGDEDVRRHDGGNVRGDRGFEGDQFDGVEPIGRMLDQRQLEVRVDAGVAVSGKVLATGRNTFGL